MPPTAQHTTPALADKPSVAETPPCVNSLASSQLDDALMKVTYLPNLEKEEARSILESA